MYLDKHIHMDVDIIVSFVLQSGQVSEGVHHLTVSFIKKKLIKSHFSVELY